jgi:hypothetical protein
VQRGRGEGIEEEEIDEAKWESKKGDEAQGTYRLLRATEWVILFAVIEFFGTGSQVSLLLVIDAI